jgi:hypothetical protein
MSHHYPNEPSSCCISNGNNVANISHSASALPSTATVPCKQCPKLLDSECKLLNENEGCIKCCHVFIDHHAVNCPNDFPNPTAYKSLTQSDVNHTKHGQGKEVAAISTSNASTSTTATTSFSSNESIVHPIATILGMSCNPAAYMAPNVLSVIGFNGDDLGSSGLFVSNLLPNMISACMQPPKETSSLHVPYLYWRCLVSSNADDFLLICDALINHGSSAALISEEYVLKLGLHCKCLPEPYSAELTMENDRQNIAIKFSEYVKLQLHDPLSF